MYSSFLVNLVCIYHACQSLSFIYFLPWGHMLLSDLINFWVPSPFLIKINKNKENSTTLCPKGPHPRITDRIAPQFLAV